MGLRWTRKAQGDLARLHGFLAPVSLSRAAGAVRAVLVGVGEIATHPRLGKRLREFDSREVRSLIVAHYEIRYQLQQDEIFILRVWHVPEDR